MERESPSDERLQSAKALTPRWYVSKRFACMLTRPWPALHNVDGSQQHARDEDLALVVSRCGGGPASNMDGGDRQATNR